MFWIFFSLIVCCLSRGGFCERYQLCYSNYSSTWGTCIEQSQSDAANKSEENSLKSINCSTEYSGMCGKNSMCCLNPRTAELPQPPHCGHSGLIRRIIGGEEAKLGELPWMAALGFLDSEERDFVNWRCGGTLITRRHVLTAAHCFDNDYFKLRTVRLGSTLLEGKNDDESSAVEIRPKVVTVHENYNMGLIQNDIAMILLEKRVTFNERIRPMCLPLQGKILTTNLEEITSQLAIVAGWGLTSRKEDLKVLRKVEIPIVKNSTCVRDYKITRVKYDVQPEHQLCAGFAMGKKGICMGDSGGPLIFLSDNRYYVLGIVSSAYGCALPNFPAVYTRVTGYTDWIINHM